MCGWSPDYRSRFRLIVACTLHSPATKWLLKVCIALSALLDMRLLGRNNWYLISIYVMSFLKSVDALLFTMFNPGLIPWIFKSVVSYVKARIIYLSLLFFVAVFVMALR